VDSERARIIALLNKCEAMLAEMAHRDDPALLPAMADVQAAALHLRARLRVVEQRNREQPRRTKME
jgi:hypothetical protein